MGGTSSEHIQPWETRMKEPFVSFTAAGWNTRIGSPGRRPRPAKATLRLQTSHIDVAVQQLGLRVISAGLARGVRTAFFSNGNVDHSLAASASANEIRPASVSVVLASPNLSICMTVVRAGHTRLLYGIYKYCPDI
jgi:hypothetical protein